MNFLISYKLISIIKNKFHLNKLHIFIVLNYETNLYSNVGTKYSDLNLNPSIVI